MTPKMATDKVNAPAVSQLAGEIADKIWAIHGFDYLVPADQNSVTKIISAALSKREEKSAKIVEALEWAERSLKFSAEHFSESHGIAVMEIIGALNRVKKALKLCAALSALGESK